MRNISRAPYPREEYAGGRQGWKTVNGDIKQQNL